jgi:hypothetical protein
MNRVHHHPVHDFGLWNDLLAIHRAQWQQRSEPRIGAKPSQALPSRSLVDGGGGSAQTLAGASGRDDYYTLEDYTRYSKVNSG